MKPHALFGLLLCAASTAAMVHESVRHPPTYVRGEQVDPRMPLDFTFALKHTPASKAWLRSTVAAVSNPDSPQYGKHVSLGEIHARMAVPSAQIAQVKQSLADAGFVDVVVHEGGDFIRARAVAAVAALYFETHFCQFAHVESLDKPIVRACKPEYHLPAEVSSLVDFVGGLVHFPQASTLKVSSADTIAPEAADTLGQLRTTYNLNGVKPTGQSATTVAFTQFIGQFYSPKDLQSFEKRYAPDQAGQTLAKNVGGSVPGNGIEANLDAQYLLGVSAGIDTWVWNNQDINTVNNQEPWVEFFTNVANNATVPDVISISYGEGYDTLTKDYMERSDVELQKIAARGITAAASSGDNGAGCTNNKFVPNFPASLPHILSVGGTDVCTAGSGAAGFSSGGFSVDYPQPAWQKDAVEAYLASAELPDEKYFDRTGRAFPDVSACGNVIICSNGFFTPVAGTSCSCPIFSGVLGLINDRRVAAGKSKLGFVAPALYKAYGDDASHFDDVVRGATQGCVGGRFRAVPGWDPATGLGTPNFEKLAETLVGY